MKKTDIIKRSKYLLFLLLPFLFIGDVLAFDFQVRPIRIYLTPNKNIGVFEIISSSNKKLTIETETLKWDQDEEGKDVLIPTENLIAIPPYIELGPKEKQIIRIAYLGDYSAPQESYRLLLKQVPERIKPDKNTKEVKTLIQIVLNLSVPVFVNRDQELNYDLKVSPTYVSKEKVEVDIENTGNSFTRIVNISLYKGDKELFSKNMAKYVLPGRKIHLSLIKYRKTEEGREVVPLEDVPNKMVLVLEDENEISIDL
ncbi:fimbrial biogenesis chaperone [Persephonella sp.]